MQLCYDILFGISTLAQNSSEFYKIVPSRTRGSKFSVNPANRAFTNVGNNDFAHRTSRLLSKLSRTVSLPLSFSEFMQQVRRA